MASWSALALWFLGYPDQALKRSQEALALAQELDHPFTLGFALAIAGAMFHELRREAQAFRECAEAEMRLSTFAHALDLALADGELTADEADYLNTLILYLELDRDDVERVADVIVLKNQY